LAEYQESVESNSEKLLHLEYNLEREKENAMNTEAMLKATRTQLQDSNDLLGGKVVYFNSGSKIEQVKLFLFLLILDFVFIVLNHNKFNIDRFKCWRVSYKKPVTKLHQLKMPTPSLQK